MSNEFFTKTGNPATGSSGSSALIRAEIAAIETAFDMMPTLTGNGGKSVKINTGGTALEASKVTVTEPATGSTLTIADGKTLTANNTVTLAGTDGTTMTFPSTSGAVVTEAATQTLTNKTLTSPTINSPTLVTPALGIPASGDISNCTGTPTLTGTNISGTAAALSIGGNASTATELTGGAFHVYKTSNQSIATITDTVLTWDAESFDTAGAFSSNKFTPNVAGKYLVISTVRAFGPTTTNGLLHIAKNGSRIKRFNIPVTSSSAAQDSESYTVSAIVDMNGSTDYLEIKLFSGVGGMTIIGDIESSYFSGCKVG
jgi:hypothetical protein